MKSYCKVAGMLFALSTLAWPVSGMAQSDDLGLGEVASEEILFQDIASVYSASKYDQKVTEAPARISIVTAREIQRYGYRTLADILNSLPGFYLNYDRNYGYSGTRGFSIGGDYNSKFLQLVDGHRMNDNIYDSGYIDGGFILDVDLIDRVEVVRGPGSSLYGNSAFFGVVNVITKKGRDLQGGEVSGAAGSFDRYQGRLSYGKRFANGFELLISATYHDSNGDDLYFEAFDDPASNHGIAAGADDENFQNIFGKLSFGDVTLEGAYVNREKGVPTAPYDTVFNDSGTRTWDKHSYLDLKYEHLTESSIELTGRLYYDQYQYDGDWICDYSEEGDLSDLQKFSDWAMGRWWGAEASATLSLLEGHKLTFGAELRDSLRQEQEEWDAYELYLDSKSNDFTWAFFLQDEYRILTNLFLNLGVRYDYFDTVGSTTNPRIALIYTPFSRTNLKLLYGTAFRAPNAYELYYHDGDITQKLADNLVPETIETFEVIVEQKLTENTRAVFSAYHNKIKDLLGLTTDPADELLVFENLGKAEAMGGEFQIEGRWDNGWAGSVSYSYQNAKNKSTGERMVNSPLNMAKANVMIPLLENKLMAGLEVQYESGRKTLNENKTDDFFLTNLTFLSKDVITGVTLSVSIYNLFDRKYAYPASEEHYQDTIDQDGRTFRIKLDYLF